MLYYMTLGDFKIAPAQWNIIKDEHDNTFIEKEDIKQRIRVDRRIDLKELPVVSSGRIQSYVLPENTKWSNNNKNMNPMLMAMGPNCSDKSEQHILYLTVDRNYKILKYDTEHRISMTYHQKDTYQGCAIIFSENEIRENKVVISIVAKDLRKDAYTTAKIIYNVKTKGIYVNYTAIDDEQVVAEYDNILARHPYSYLGFKIMSKPSELLTCTFVVNSKFKSLAESISKNIKNANIILVDKEDVLDKENLSEEATKKLNEEITEKGIRAVTLIGTNLPLPICKKYRLLYVFNYDVKHDVLSCMKSN